MNKPPFVLCLLAGFLASAVLARATAPVDLAAALQQWLGQQPHGVAAAWIDAGGVQFASAGQFSATDTRPIAPDTEFEIGSVTKVFTALLLADAIQAGRVMLEAPVGAPFAPSAITYLQLATHTSGLPRLPKDFTAGELDNPYGAIVLEALVASFAAAAPTAQAGQASYSNFGFAVLGQAVAQAWGSPYPALVRERLLVPLGLRDTFVRWSEADHTRLAPGHGETGVPVRNWDFEAYAPAGALTSTSRDLARFIQANLGLVETPLTAQLAEIKQPLVAGDMPARQIGLAWQIEQRGQSEVIWHNGGTGGYRSFIAFDPARKVGVVLLTNSVRGLETLGFALIAGKMPPAPKPSVSPADSVQEYLGNYPLAPSFVMAVTAEGEQLYLQATNQPRVKLERRAPDHYRVVGVAAEVSFERDAGGKILALLLHQNGHNQRALRLAPGVKPAAPAEVALAPEQLADYVGRYALGPVVFTVSVEDGRLLVQLTGQPKAPVYASAKDEFFYKVVDAQLSFQRDASGRVVALVLHQHGRVQRAGKQ